MSSDEIRKKFLAFFSSKGGSASGGKEKGHAIVPSSSLVPTDPSVLLTTAGMQQFKPYFTGELDPMKDFGARSTASVQKSFRMSDIDSVGDETHLTFFEMLGNFSFGRRPGEASGPEGGYFKEEAIRYAFEFITDVMGLPISYVSIFRGSDAVPKDEESKRIWHSLGVRDVREEGMEDVFWGPTGSAGPCGPTTEIYVNSALRQAQGKPPTEVWNIVFNEFLCSGSRDDLLAGRAKLAPLPMKGIDTGMGLERLAMVAQGAATIFEADLFMPLMAAVREVAPAIPPRSQRIFADHLRAAVFLIADGVRPSNKDAGYILRRLLRRMLAHRIVLDVHGNLFRAGFEAVRETLGATYPEVRDPRILEVMEAEEQKFARAIARGIGEIKKFEKIAAKDAFYLYESFGLPYELIRELAPEASRGLTRHDFDREFRQHQETSRAGAEKKFGGHGLLLDTGELKARDEEELKKVTRLHTATHLLQAALRKVLGSEVTQAGSDITAERTRFDFTFSRKLMPQELGEVEKLVNGAIQADLPMGYIEMSKEEAAKTGALYFFKEKYPDRVKVYFAGHTLETAFSKEFCGGPHVAHTGEIGEFKIAKEEAVGAGVRRIRGVVVP